MTLDIRGRLGPNTYMRMEAFDFRDGARPTNLIGGVITEKPSAAAPVPPHPVQAGRNPTLLQLPLPRMYATIRPVAQPVLLRIASA